MNEKMFTAPVFNICKISDYDVITDSVLNLHDKLEGGDYGDVIGFDEL